LWDDWGNPDCVFHLAWENLVDYSSLHHLTKNLPNQINFFKRLIDSGCPKIVATGTCFEYGRRYGPLQEDMVCNPDNSYAIAKDSLRRVAFQLSEDTSTIIVWARLFYMYGNYQRKESLFGQLTQALKDKSKVFRMSQGEQLKDYIAVNDIARYLYLLSKKAHCSDIVNVASGKPVSIRKLVEDICKERNADMKLELGYYPYSVFETVASWADIAKLERIIKGNSI